jgi:hypothetical protein
MRPRSKVGACGIALAANGLLVRVDLFEHSSIAPPTSSTSAPTKSTRPSLNPRISSAGADIGAVAMGVDSEIVCSSILTSVARARNGCLRSRASRAAIESTRCA